MDLRNSSLSSAGGFELWGFPGAGKSTQARLLRRRAELSLVGLHSLPVSLAIRPSVAMEAMSDAIIRRGLLRPRSSAGRFARVTVRQIVALRARPYNVVEEGLVHEIWRGLYSADEAPLQGWQSFMPYVGPNIILLDVEPQEALRRILTKKKLGPVNRQLADIGIDKPRWRRAIAAYEQLQEEIRRTPNVSLNRIKVDEMSPFEVSEEIVRIVQHNQQS